MLTRPLVINTEHRITGKFRLKGTSRGLWDQTKRLYQKGLENHQGQRLHDLCGQSVPLLDCSHGERMSLYNHSEPLLFQCLLFLIIQPCIAMKKPAPFPWCCPQQLLLDTPKSLLLQAAPVHILQSLLAGQLLLSTIMAVLCWACSASSTSFLYREWVKTCPRYL